VSEQTPQLAPARRQVDQPREISKRKFVARLVNAGWKRREARAAWTKHLAELEGNGK